LGPVANHLPPSGVLACGALGRYDADRVGAIAAALSPTTSVVHSDQRSILALDRPPVRWQGSRQTGLGWTERVGGVADARFGSWREASSAGAVSGLVIEGRRRYLHTSVSGALPVYYQQEAGAVYFATRIDPLVTAAPGTLSIDWDAWAAMLTLDYPLGDRTPFSEIRALGPFETLAWRRGRMRVADGGWPWAEVEPTLGIEEGSADLLERLREGVARLPAGPIACQLSGGWDSRVCLGLLAEQRREDTFALTVDHDGGTDREIAIATEVASILRVPHEVATGAADGYWRDMVMRTERVDYQLVRPPWRVPEIEPLMRVPAPVIDGLALDALAMPGERFFTREAIAANGNDAAARGLWKRLKAMQSKRGSSALDPKLARALWAASRRQFLAGSAPYRGNPNRLPLTFYRTRLARGIALSVHRILGTDLPMATPLMDDEAVRALLAIRPEEKYGGRIYYSLFEALEPALAAVPTTSMGEPPPGRRLPRRSQTAAVAETYAERLRSGPLAPFVRNRIHRILSRHRAGKRNPRVPRAVLGPAVFSLWHERYRDRLREVDPRDVL
jgi:Asparagine synthase